jgi:hypothetical protein
MSESFFLLTALGGTFIITHSKIGEVFRNSFTGLFLIIDWYSGSAQKYERFMWAEASEVFIRCPQCVGFWIGFLFSWWIYGEWMIQYGLAVSFLAFAFNSVLKVLIPLEILVKDNIE